MIQCEQCEHFRRGPGGEARLMCDPFSTIKESECLQKWQLQRLAELSRKADRMVEAYEATLEIYRRFEPLPEKLFRHMEREIDDAEESDSWKYEDDDEADGAEGR